LPELPEVETVRRGLAPLCEDRTIVSAEFSRDDILIVPDDAGQKPARWAQEFTEGMVIDRVYRHGKYLLFDTEGERGWAVHLGMSGSLVVYTDGAAPDKHTHAVLNMCCGAELHYRAPRRFGRWIAARDGPARTAVSGRVGIDALDPTLDVRRFMNRLGGSQATIKSRLLDQRLVAGLGNIYADEALFAAGIHPRCPASSLDPGRWATLLRGIRSVLRRALANGGTTFASYRDARGRKGGNRGHLSVYGREGEQCPRCGNSVERIKVAGRGTHCCAACQQMPE